MTKPYPNLRDCYEDKDEPVTYEEDNIDCPHCRELMEVIQDADRRLITRTAMLRKVREYVPKLVQKQIDEALK